MLSNIYAFGRTKKPQQQIDSEPKLTPGNEKKKAQNKEPQWSATKKRKTARKQGDAKASPWSLEKWNQQKDQKKWTGSQNDLQPEKNEKSQEKTEQNQDTIIGYQKSLLVQSLIGFYFVSTENVSQVAATLD